MKFGKFEIFSVSDGFFRLDGGAMFGVVPRFLWEKTNPPDDRNRILLSLRPLLIKAGKKNILVDTGIGGKGDEKFCSTFGVDRSPTLIESLSHLSLKAEDIDIVINTHLHFDHAGGNTFKDHDGSIRPTFPRAKYIVQKGDWEDATQPNERTKASYLKENFLPVMEAGQMELIEGDIEVEKGVKTLLTPGHISHLQLVMIESIGNQAVYLCDLIPTVSHLPYPYIMGYDLFPLKTLEAKKRLLKQACEERWLTIFEHDPKIKMGYVKMVGGRPILKEVDKRKINRHG